MQATLTIVRYPKAYSFFGFLSMAVFHVFLMRNKEVSFYKLMGSGKNGTFDIRPDWRQWALMAAYPALATQNKTLQELYGNFIAGWWKRFRCEVTTYALEPIEGHGKWDGKECFGTLPKSGPYEGVIAVLTRATIRLNKAKSFWQNVGGAAGAMTAAPGFITSFGIGEVPWLRQATFSIWQSKEAMKQYAYGTRSHRDVIQKTRKQDWYSEEMFVRFRILSVTGRGSPAFHGTF